jgi:hypothetical protein
MNNILEHFRDGGWGMFPTLVFGSFLLAMAVRYAAARRAEDARRLVPLLVASGILTLSAGMLGFVSGVMVTCGAIAHVDNAPVIALLGLGESLNDLAFALIFMVTAAMAASYGAWRLSSVKSGPTMLTTPPA